jgi:hypothetical protein
MLLRDIPPRFASSYLLSSTITLPTANRPLAEAIAPWADVGDCPLDPAQLVLDCVIDAMAMGPAADCVPDSLPPAAAAVQNARGTLTGACRTSNTATGGPALELLLSEALGEEAAALAEAMSTLDVKAASLIATMELESILVIDGVTADGDLLMRHELSMIKLGPPGNQAAYAVSSIGAPVYLASPVSGHLADDGEVLQIEQHGFSTQYDLLVPTALGELVLEPLGHPTDPADIAADLFEAIRIQQSGSTVAGCAALDAIVCPAARLPAGCVAQACPDGRAALASRLRTSFARSAAQHTDLVLAGSAQWRDNDGDLEVDELGQAAAPGQWEASIQLRGASVDSVKSTFLGSAR